MGYGKSAGAKLTEKQIRFCECIAADMNLVDAYRKAYGYQGEYHTCHALARKVYNKRHIQDEIDRQREFLNTAMDIDGVSPEDRIAMSQEGEVNTGKVNVLNKEANGDWTQEIVLKKMQAFLTSCEDSLILIRERPKLFADVRILIKDVRNKLDFTDPDSVKEDILQTLDNMEDIIYKVGQFKASEFNSTINTANGLVKEMNKITGISKNIREVKNETFESKLLDMISKSESGDLAKELEEYAFEQGSKDTK